MYVVELSQATLSLTLLFAKLTEMKFLFARIQNTQKVLFSMLTREIASK